MNCVLGTRPAEWCIPPLQRAMGSVYEALEAGLRVPSSLAIAMWRTGTAQRGYEEVLFEVGVGERVVVVNGRALPGIPRGGSGSSKL